MILRSTVFYTKVLKQNTKGKIQLLENKETAQNTKMTL